ncbi:MAG: VOC family protein [Vulcanimicrobiaceae bacterium]
MFEPILDHAVIDARNRLDEAASLYRRLGFALSARGHHTLGSSNHLAIFASTYLEVLGWEAGAAMKRPELQRYPIGLNGLVFRAQDADTVTAELTKVGLTAQPPVALARQVRLPNGAQMEARFRTVRFDDDTFGSTRAYFCEHFTPELVWRPEWQYHDNAVVDIVRVVIQASHPHRLGTVFATMFGETRLRLDGETCVLDAGQVKIEIMQRSEVARAFPDATPDLGTRDEAMVGLGFRSAHLAKTAAALAKGEIPSRQTGSTRIIVPAAAALGVTLEFVP